MGLTRDSRGHCAAQRRDSCHGNLLVRIFLGAGVAWGYHIGLQQGAFQVDVMVTQSLVDSSQHLRQGRPKWGEVELGGRGSPPGAPTQLPSPPHCPGRQATYLLGYILTAFQVMVPIRKDLRLHDGHNTILWGEGQGSNEAS